MVMSEDLLTVYCWLGLLCYSFCLMSLAGFYVSFPYNLVCSYQGISVVEFGGITAVL